MRGEPIRQCTAKVTGSMGAQRTFLCLVLYLLTAWAQAGSPQDISHESAEKTIELFDGVTMHVPVAESRNKTENKLVSFEIDTIKRTSEGAYQVNLFLKTT